MSLDAIKCPKCRQPLPDNFLNNGISDCTFCGKRVGITVYPALFRKSEQHDHSKNQVEEGDSCCFYHENLNATVHCEVCGRFLCDLCRVDMNGKEICPNCIMGNRDTGKVGDLEKRRPLHCRSAILAAVIGGPLCFFFAGQIVAIIYGIKGLMQKPPAYSRGLDEKLSSILALVLAASGILGGLFFWASVFFSD